MVALSGLTGSGTITADDYRQQAAEAREKMG